MSQQLSHLLARHLQRLIAPTLLRGIDWDANQHPRGSNGKFVGTAGGNHTPLGGEGYAAHREHAFLSKVVANAKVKAAEMSEQDAHAFLKSIQARGLTGLNAINARMLHLNHAANVGALRMTHPDWQQLATLRSLYRSRVNNPRNQHQGAELNAYSRNRLNREISFIDGFAQRRGMSLTNTKLLPADQRAELAQVIDEAIARDAARYAPKATQRVVEALDLLRWRIAEQQQTLARHTQQVAPAAKTTKPKKPRAKVQRMALARSIMAQYRRPPQAERLG